jgi:uncharacterized protein (TIGR00251 family)
MKLSIKVVPGSSSDCIAGWLDGTLKVRVRANAEKGKANRAVEKLIAKELGLSTRDVRIITGGSSARKVVEVDGVPAAQVVEKLSDAVS